MLAAECHEVSLLEVGWKPSILFERISAPKYAHVNFAGRWKLPSRSAARAGEIGIHEIGIQWDGF